MPSGMFGHEGYKSVQSAKAFSNGIHSRSRLDIKSLFKVVEKKTFDILYYFPIAVLGKHDVNHPFPANFVLKPPTHLNAPTSAHKYFFLLHIF